MLLLSPPLNKKPGSHRRCYKQRCLWRMLLSTRKTVNFFKLISDFENHQEAAGHEILKIWLQPLHNSVAEGKSILHRSEPRQWCLTSLVCNQGRLSIEIKEWKVLFNYFFQYLFVVTPYSIAPAITLMNDVIHGEQNRHILQTDLKPMENLLQLKQLEVLRLSNLSEIQDLTEQICHLSSLQFLYVNGCERLPSLPSEIGRLKNLKAFDFI